MSKITRITIGSVWESTPKYQSTYVNSKPHEVVYVIILSGIVDKALYRIITVPQYHFGSGPTGGLINGSFLKGWFRCIHEGENHGTK